MSIKPEGVTTSNRVKFPDLAHLNRYASAGNGTFLLFGTTSPCRNASGLFVSLGHHRGQIGSGHAQPASFDDQLDVRPSAANQSAGLLVAQRHSGLNLITIRLLLDRLKFSIS